MSRDRFTEKDEKGRWAVALDSNNQLLVEYSEVSNRDGSKTCTPTMVYAPFIDRLAEYEDLVFFPGDAERDYRGMERVGRREKQRAHDNYSRMGGVLVLIVDGYKMAEGTATIQISNTDPFEVNGVFLYRPDIELWTVAPCEAYPWGGTFYPEEIVKIEEGGNCA